MIIILLEVERKYPKYKSNVFDLKVENWAKQQFFIFILLLRVIYFNKNRKTSNKLKAINISKLVL